MSLSMKVKILLVDDDIVAAEHLKMQLQQFDFLEILSSINNLQRASYFVENNTVDVIFIDISVHLTQSFDWISQMSHKYLVVITTSYKEFALKSFECNVLDYLIKPISFDRLVKTINKIFQHTLSKSLRTAELTKSAHIFMKVNKKLVRINLNDVLYVESLKDYIRIHSTQGTYIVHKSLTAFTEELPWHDFMRIHRSFMVSIHKISAIEGNILEVQGIRIPIGRHYSKEVKKRIFNFSLTTKTPL